MVEKMTRYSSVKSQDVDMQAKKKKLEISFDIQWKTALTMGNVQKITKGYRWKIMFFFYLLTAIARQERQFEHSKI